MGLLDLAEVVMHGWTLVGGQMVHLLCAEWGVAPARTAPDVDTAVDARRVPEIFGVVTAALEGLGFVVDGEKQERKHIRWKQGCEVTGHRVPQVTRVRRRGNSRVMKSKERNRQRRLAGDLKCSPGAG